MTAFGTSTDAAVSGDAASEPDGSSAGQRDRPSQASADALHEPSNAIADTTAACASAGGGLCAGTLEAPRAVFCDIGDGVRARLLAGRYRRRSSDANSAASAGVGASLHGRHVAELAADEDDDDGGSPDAMCGTAEFLSETLEAMMGSPSAVLPASDLADPTRKVVVVTTAAMPWRTGTAVNPLLRALYLIRYQDGLRRRLLERGESLLDTGYEGAGGAAAEPSCGVTLAVPWLESAGDRAKLYGQHNFPDGDEGMAAQERWIRHHASTCCGMPDEARRLRLLFYPAFYLAGFGSIFPRVDLCRFVSGAGHGDVAVLEEPEHLNWFRMPEARGGGGGSGKGSSSGNGAGSPELEHDLELEETTAGEDAEDGAAAQRSNVDATDGSDPPPPARDGEGPPAEQSLTKTEADRLARATKLGWTHRFRYVVGVVHTNYEAYASRYGIGAQLIAGPAIGAVSALTIRAHCHQVVKLSDALPSFAPGKELTCNVHGVRAEFLAPVDLDAICGRSGRGGDGGPAPSPVYFIGKLVWAKGFDVMLDLQDVFRRRNGAYFDVDIYGGGPEQKEIARAFHGRNHRSPGDRPESPRKQQQQEPALARSGSRQDVSAMAVFDHPESIKDQSSRVMERLNEKRRKSEAGGGYDVIAEYLSLGFEVTHDYADGADEGEVTYVRESRDGKRADDEGVLSSPSGADRKRNPLAIIGELSGQSMHTTVKTGQAVYDIADSSIKNILNMSFSQLRNRKEKKQKEEIVDKKSGRTDAESTENEEGKGDAKDEEEPKFVFDPPASRFEWRRHPIPARFPGVVDHAELRDVGHKIFLNPSTSEVLCTTSAEALAMNKFVILPRHPSNSFFEGFANCLTYDTLEECAERMEWALANDPAPLSEDERRRFTWEAATERLVESSAVTVGQARERSENGMDRTDERIAFWLAESGEKSSLIKGFLNREGKDG